MVSVASAVPQKDHLAISAWMLDEAEAMIAQEDRLQASEKLWGAFAHRLYALAERWGWPYRTHADGIAIAEYVVAQAGDAEIGNLFRGARDAHRNFYADDYALAYLADLAAQFRRWMPLLDAADDSLPLTLGPPPRTDYRKRNDLPAAEPFDGG